MEDLEDFGGPRKFVVLRTWSDFDRFSQGSLRDFRGLWGILEDFAGTWRDFRELWETLGDFKGLRGTVEDFGGL